MVKVRKAYAEDFEKVYPLLTQISDTCPKQVWRNLFQNGWPSDYDYFGYVLEQEEHIVGYFGAIFSERTIKGQTYQFCDMGNWIVEEKYRKQSVMLMMPFLKLKNVILTNSTASRHVFNILKKFGFKEQDTHFRVLPLNGIPLFSTAKEFVQLNKEEMTGYLDENDLQIYRDHSKFKCIYFLFVCDGHYCFGVATRVVKKNIPFLLIHYLSNLPLFKKNAHRLVTSICLRHQVMGMLIGGQEGDHCDIKFSFKVRMPQPNVFKSDDLPREDINFLYSEQVLLSL